MKKFRTLCLILAIISCNKSINSNSIPNIAQPETLLDFSHEKISFSFVDANSLNEIEAYIDKNIPSKAELVCDNNKLLCDDAKRLFQSKNIDFTEINNKEIEPYVALIYDRIVAKDCQNNLNNDFLGCANAVNMVQMVGNYKQFVKPELIDQADAAKASKNYRKYQKK